MSEVKLLYPLDEFYREAGLALPEARQVPGESVPEPCRQLLVHERDMTPTLEAFHGARIHLDVLKWRLDTRAYWREVILRLNGSDRPVEFGAIVIYLDLFPPAARDEVLGGRRPLGTILADHSIVHKSCPQAFFEIHSDPVMRQALDIPQPAVLYGRRNVHRTLRGQVLADILEIMPPLHVDGKRPEKRLHPQGAGLTPTPAGDG